LIRPVSRREAFKVALTVLAVASLEAAAAAA